MTTSTLHTAADVAVTYETNWDGSSIAWVSVAAVACIVWIAATPFLWALVDESTERRSGWLRMPAFLLTGAVTLLALFGAYVLPGAIMRHLPHHEQVWLVVGGAVVAVAALAWWSWREDWDRWMFWVAAGVIAVGTLLGAAFDALNRSAASIPMGAGALLTLLIVGAAVIFLWMRKD